MVSLNPTQKLQKHSRPYRSASMSNPSSSDPEIAAWLQIIERKVAALGFGSVQIIVHEGRVTQIESTEKFRFKSRQSGDSASPSDVSENNNSEDAAPGQ